MRRQVFGVWFFVFLVWTFYRIFVAQSEWVDELVAKPLFFIVPVILVVKAFEKKSLFDIGFRFTLKNIISDSFVGVLIGSAFAVEAVIVNLIKHSELSLSLLPAVKMAGGVAPFALITIVTAISEEVLTRGYVFNRLLEIEESEVRATVITTFLFVVLHLPIALTKLSLSGPSLAVYLMSLVVLSVVGCFFAKNRSLLLPILIHFFWSFTVSLYL